MVNQVINKTLLEDQREGSFIVVNVDGIVNQYRQWKELMPRVRPFYAIKANPLPIIAEVLAALGAGFDCASQVSDEHIGAILHQRVGVWNFFEDDFSRYVFLLGPANFSVNLN